MRIILARIFRFIFKSPYFRHRFFGFHTKIVSPLNLFKGVKQTIQYHDFKLTLNLEDWIQQNIYFVGKYEDAELKAVENFLEKGSTFIDVGANIGLYTLNASRLVGEKGKIFAFEPFSQNFESLSRNIALNKLSNVQPEKLAVGDTNGTLSLYYDESEKNLGMVSAQPLSNSTIENVEVVSLDSYLKNKEVGTIDLIKIDIEGFEYPALLGMKETLISYAPVLLIEILSSTEQRLTASSLFEFLHELGYQQYFIDNNGNISLKNVNRLRRNYLFVKTPQTSYS